MSFKLTFIINSLRPPKKNIAEVIESCIDFLGFSYVTIFKTEYAGHAILLAGEAVKSGTQLMVAVGGDGTFSEVMNGVIQSGEKKIVLALIPNGTGNDFCRGQQIVFDKESFMTSLQKLSCKEYDVGKIIGNSGVRYFLNIADIGFGGFAAHVLNQQRKSGLKGGLSYTLAILRSFLGFRKPEVQIYSKDLLYEGKLMMCAICNGSTFGNGLVISPDAKVDDGLLNLTIIGDVSIWDYLRNYFNLKKGIKIKHKNVFYHKAQFGSIKILSGSTPIEIDGEVFGDGDIEFSILPKTIKILDYN